jgi:hypothetical protein
VDSRAPTRIIASCFALSAFAIALIAGLNADRSASAILSTAVFALVVCYILGLIIASMANVAVSERIDQLKAEKPIPTYDDQPKTPQSPHPPEQASQAA